MPEDNSSTLSRYQSHLANLRAGADPGNLRAFERGRSNRPRVEAPRPGSVYADFDLAIARATERMSKPRMSEAAKRIKELAKDFDNRDKDVSAESFLSDMLPKPIDEETRVGRGGGLVSGFQEGGPVGTLAAFQQSLPAVPQIGGPLGRQGADPFGLQASAAPRVSVPTTPHDSNAAILAAQERMSGAMPDSMATALQRQLQDLREQNTALEKKIDERPSLFSSLFGGLFGGNRNRGRGSSGRNLSGRRSPPPKPKWVATDATWEGKDGGVVMRNRFQAGGPIGLPGIADIPPQIGSELSRAEEGLGLGPGAGMEDLPPELTDAVIELVNETADAIRGTHPNPVRGEAAIQEFIELFGEEAFVQFREGVMEKGREQDLMAGATDADMAAGMDLAAGDSLAAAGDLAAGQELGLAAQMGAMSGAPPGGIGSLPPPPGVAPPTMMAQGGKVDPPGDFSYEAWGSIPPMPMRHGGPIRRPRYQEGGEIEAPPFSYEAFGNMGQAPRMPLQGGGPVMRRRPRFQAGGLISGQGDGMSDSIPGTIEGQEDVLLSDGEYIVPADAVSGLGNGSTRAGANVLRDMVGQIRQARTGGRVQSPPLRPSKVLPR